MNENDKKIIKRAIWLAFQASIPMGMGVLHIEIANSATEKNLIHDSEIQEEDGELFFHADYLCGRMMKTGFKVKRGKLQVTPFVPRGDYQSWSGEYPTAEKLIEKTYKSLK